MPGYRMACVGRRGSKVMLIPLFQVELEADNRRGE
jgi:hypothetical protein